MRRKNTNFKFEEIEEIKKHRIESNQNTTEIRNKQN